MMIFLLIIVIAGAILIVGLAFNVIRPAKRYVWISDNPFDKSYESHHKDSWTDSH